MTILDPLKTDLESTNFSEFLLTSKFERALIQSNWGTLWAWGIDFANENSVILEFIDDEEIERTEAFYAILINLVAQERFDFLKDFLEVILLEFFEWVKVQLPIEELLADLGIIGFVNDELKDFAKVYESRLSELVVIEPDSTNLSVKQDSSKDFDLVEIQRTIFELIAKGRIDKVIAEFDRLAWGLGKKAMVKEVTIISYRWKRNRNVELNDTRDHRSIQQEENRIISTLTEMAQKLI